MGDNVTDDGLSRESLSRLPDAFDTEQETARYASGDDAMSLFVSETFSAVSVTALGNAPGFASLTTSQTDGISGVAKDLSLDGAGATAQNSPARTGSRLHYLEALVDASKAISATLDPNRVADILVASTAAILDVPGVTLIVVDDRERIRVAASRGLSTAYVQAQAGPLDDSITGRALAEARTFATWDARQIADSRLARAAAAEGIVAVACSPMFFGGKAVGALSVHCHDPHCFSPDQFHVLSLLAAQGAVALTNARAYGQLRKQAAEVRAGFQRVGDALSASLDIGETLRLIVQLAVEMTKADGGAFFTVLDAEQGGGMRLAGMRGMESRSVRRFRMTSASGIASRALAEGRAIIIPDTRQVTDVAFPTLRLTIDETAETRSVVCVPVIVGDRPLGVLEQYSAEPGRFTQSDVHLLSSFAVQASVAIENARMYAQERSVAQTLQRAFLPELPHSISGFEIGRIYAPGSEIAAVGGDTYDLFTLPNGKIAALMADVSGHGTFAATLAVMAKYTVRAYAIDNPDPSSVLRRVNEALIPQTGDSTFLTLCFGLIDPQTRAVTIASAAHPPVMHWRADAGTTVALDVPSGLIAGFLHDQEYPSRTIVLNGGDVLVLYTDGVIEARRDKVMFSADDKLENVISENVHLPAQDIAAAIYNAVIDWVAGERTDDIALLVLKAV